MLTPASGTIGRLVGRGICVAVLLSPAVGCRNQSPPQHVATGSPPYAYVNVIPWNPLVRSQPLPALPDAAKRAGVHGPVVLEARVDEAGKVTVLRVVRGDLLLNDLAIAAAGRWQFLPNKVHGVATPFVLTLLVNFTER